MRSVKAVFKKQVKDIKENITVLIQFIIFPAIAWFMTKFVASADDFGGPDTMFVTMFAAIFVGMALIPTVAGIVAEDRERRSLRFLVMAGVKPQAYLLGIGGVIFFVSLLPAFAFTWLGGFAGEEFWLFMAAMMSGVIASTLLGLTIGILAKNQQAATSLSMPAALVFGFGPLIAMFNERIGELFRFFYTQQLDVVMSGLMGSYDTGVSLQQSFATIWANVAVLAALFVVAFGKKGLKA